MRRCHTQTRHAHNYGPEAVATDIGDVNAKETKQGRQEPRTAKITKKMLDVVQTSSVDGLKAVQQNYQ